jgi:HSP20 family protein
MNNLMHYHPLHLISSVLNKEFGRALNRPATESDSSVVEGSRWAPLVDIVEEPSSFVLYADIPGVDPQAIEIHMENGVLSIRGERVSAHKPEEVNFSRVERVAGTFERRFALPDTADPDHITAHGRHGVLEVAIPKRDKAKARKITVEEKT